MKIIKIVTHLLIPDKAAELFYKEGIIAIGWHKIGDLTGLTESQIAVLSQKMVVQNQRVKVM
jgi:hypothetical protein